ncbi:M23 family metallopeptidase [Sphingomonas sp. ASV193]|uniref:M23 family metallopeptidase n=1 Tax=Sphingomonas sp. ASV193 TaxID=3144405 RepID=UPI0032E8877A
MLRKREFFLHDGAHLRRISLTVPVQALFAFILVAMVGWSGFATARLLTGGTAASSDVVAATEARTAALEQRQEMIEKMLAGERVDPAMVAATRASGKLPPRVEALLARAERATTVQAQLLAAKLDQRYEEQVAAMKALGFQPGVGGGQGGPFEAIKSGDATFRNLFNSWKKLDNLADGAIAVPSEKPVQTAAFTSGFGVRADPFHAGAAMHPGIDLAGPVGTPIYATADGTVLRAGWNSGGYGNLVEIDHGRGITTRYGHMSAVLVHAGQHISRGQQIGRMGSTGRSTGSHLHYEVRIDGRAVNPIPFMKSNDYLIAMQKKGPGVQSMDAVALGGPQR